VDKFNLKFKGELLPGHDLDRVVELFAQSFHIDDLSRAANFFTGREIILRRNLPKEEAAKVFVSLRQIGMVTFTEKVELEALTPPTPSSDQSATKTIEQLEPQVVEEVVLSSEPHTPQSPATKTKGGQAEDMPVRRKRQPGAPNFFDLRLSDKASEDGTVVARSSTLTRAPLIAAGIALLAFLLVGARFWSQNLVDIGTGLGAVNIDARQQPVVQIGGVLYWHDRAGIDTHYLDLSRVDLNPVVQFDFFGTGELAVLQDTKPNSNTDRLRSLFGDAATSQASLQRCTSEGMKCIELLSENTEIDFLIDRRTNTVLVASAHRDVLEKLDFNGKLLASHAMELSAPVHLRLQEGILYLTQGQSDTVSVLKPDDRDFGTELDSIPLTVAEAKQSGHIFPADILYGNERWWAVMQSRDGSTSGLYLFNSRWEFEKQIPLPAGAQPFELNRWSSKILVSDLNNNAIYRFDTAARQEKNFASEAVVAALTQQQSDLDTSQSLQASILVMLFGVAAGMLAFSILQIMRERIYTAPGDDNEIGFDINSEDIEWLAPALNSDKRLRQIGYSLAGGAVIALIGSFIVGLSIWAMLAVSLILIGVGGLYFSLQRACSCHLGILEDRLIVVDHTNTYRVGSGPKIQYFRNYVMIDDVIVYLGNRLVSQFANERLQQRFQPLFTTGIKVDRATLRVKLIQRRHPMLIGISGLAVAVACAATLIALTQ
jgi:hypothetical protein